MKKPKAGTNSPRKSKAEYSAGGIVQDGTNLLMIKVRKKEGEVWTFPKGHLDPGETEEIAAIREVREETGYECEILKPFERVRYFFEREGVRIEKNVTWFLMKPISKTGTFDTDEIMESEWVPFDEAQKRATYRSDEQLLAKLKLL
jgi:diadenosine hexaphosphate hydrolase (ATP-forming)